MLGPKSMESEKAFKVIFCSFCSFFRKSRNLIGEWKANMWNNYPAHEVQQIKEIPFIHETLKEVQNDLQEKKVY